VDFKTCLRSACVSSLYTILVQPNSPLECSSETELRVRGNLVLSDSGIGMMSLRDWYNKYNHPQTRASHIQVPAGALKGNKSGRAISLELFIDTDQVMLVFHLLSIHIHNDCNSMKNALVKIILGVVTRENQCQVASLEQNAFVDAVLLLKANHQLPSG
jgi:hypothetical protein